MHDLLTVTRSVPFFSGHTVHKLISQRNPQHNLSPYLYSLKSGSERTNALVLSHLLSDPWDTFLTHFWMSKRRLLDVHNMYKRRLKDIRIWTYKCFSFDTSSNEKSLGCISLFLTHFWMSKDVSEMSFRCLQHTNNVPKTSGSEPKNTSILFYLLSDSIRCISLFLTHFWMSNDVSEMSFRCLQHTKDVPKTSGSEPKIASILFLPSKRSSELAELAF